MHVPPRLCCLQCDNHQQIVNSFIFSQLFGEDDPDQDVSPDTADPELAG